MSYFLFPDKLSLNKEFKIGGTEAKHILLSRRIKKGEKIILQDRDQKRFEVEVIDSNKKSLTVKTVLEIEIPSEPKTKITLFQPLIKEKAIDFIIQKITELGASEIVVFPTQNSPIDTHKIDKRVSRWNKISEEASKQSERVAGIKISFLNSLTEAINQTEQIEQIFVLDKNAKTSFSDFYKNNKTTINGVGIFLGPEGGFTQKELATLLSLPNATTINMGQFVLRADTVAVASVAVVSTVC